MRAIPRIPPNLFSIPFGLAGLGDAWSAARALLGVPLAVADAIYAFTALIWLALVLAYASRGLRQLMADVADPVLGPFVSLIVITPMVLGGALVPASLTAARVVVVTFLVLTIGAGAWLTANWMTGGADYEKIHPGYFLPTVAGGLIASFACSIVHLHALAEAMFGIGVICWLLLNSVVLTRLFFRPPLPAALLPTLAIELAPPVVGGIAWFGLNGGRIDLVARLLGGYAILMALVQLSFVPRYARLAFSPGFWAFTFSYAAATTDGLLWLALARPAGAKAYSIALVILITVFIVAIAVRSLVAIKRGKFFPPLAPPALAATPAPAESSR